MTWIYDDLIIAGGICSIIICIGFIVAGCYEGIKIFKRVKDQAFKSVISTVMQAFCCGLGSTVLDNYQWVANGFQQVPTIIP